MEKNILENIGKRTPYTMPQGFNANALMANAIAINRKRQLFYRILWGGGAVAAAASVAILLCVSALMPSDPVRDYNVALAEYFECATDLDIESRENMAEVDVLNYMDVYEDYYN